VKSRAWKVRERANVLLMDQRNCMRYQRRQQFSSYGGEALSSPVRLQVPTAGHWYVVLDLGELQRDHPLQPDAGEVIGGAASRTQSSQKHQEVHSMSAAFMAPTPAKALNRLAGILDPSNVRAKLADPQEGTGMSDRQLDLAN
jgi:Domain of unknown function (DUF1883)